MVQGSVIERHVVGTTIKLVLVARYQASVINQVVHRQPLLEDVTEVLLRVLGVEQGGVDDLKKTVTTTLTRRSVSSSRTSLVVG